MRIDEISSDCDTAVTIGKFDGVHTGHTRIMSDLSAAAADRGLETVAITFDRNPLELIRPELAPRALTSSSQREELLQLAGVDRVIVLEFTRELMATEPEEFVKAIFERLRAKLVMVGPDFTFGKGGRGNATTLMQAAGGYGAEVRVIDDICVRDGRRISSTWIRDALTLGRVEDAAIMLGRLPSVRGIVVRGAQRGRELGFPTANLETNPQGFVPADGVYAAWATVGGVRYPAAVSVGNNPTFGGEIERVVEAHLIDVDVDCYDQLMTVEFVSFLRTMHRFGSGEELVEQMHRDIGDAREVLLAHPSS